MKKVSEIMKDMGFNPEAPEETQKAFIKYLIRIANKGRHIPEPAHLDQRSGESEEWQELKLHSKGIKKSTEKNPEQLSFPFIEKKSQPKAV